MDRLIYTALSGAKQILEQQATTAHNLANVSTTGFRAQLDAFRAVPIVGGGPLATRAFVSDATVATDFAPGAIQHTGRDLDVAVQGKGWIAVQLEDGTEAYTRNGSLRVNENGVLQTESGATVLGDGGPITIPPDMSVMVGKDGSISGMQVGFKPGATTPLGRIKLVNPPEENLVRGGDGMFRTRDGVPADVDADVTVVGAALEGSNVNVVDAMVNMIDLARQFEMNMSLLKNAESNETKAAQLFNLGG